MFRKLFGNKKDTKKPEEPQPQQECVPRGNRPMAVEFEPKNVYFVYTPVAHSQERIQTHNMKEIERKLTALCVQNERLVAALRNLQGGNDINNSVDEVINSNYPYDAIRDVKPTRRLALASTISTSTPLKDISADDSKPFLDASALNTSKDGRGDVFKDSTPAEQCKMEMARSWRVARRLAAYCHKDNANAAALARIVESVAKGRMPSEVDLHLTNFEQLDSDGENCEEDDECFDRSCDKLGSPRLDAFLMELKSVCEDTLAKSELIHQNVITCIGAGLLKKSSPPSSLSISTPPQHANHNGVRSSVSEASSFIGAHPANTSNVAE